jgi:hypothetical protein
MAMMNAGKNHRKVMTAIARELLGFTWAIGIKAEAAAGKQQIAAWSGPKEQKQNFPNKEKAKTNRPMNNVIQFEDRVSRSRSKARRRTLGGHLRQAQPDSSE